MKSKSDKTSSERREEKQADENSGGGETTEEEHARREDKSVEKGVLKAEEGKERGSSPDHHGGFATSFSRYFFIVFAVGVMALSVLVVKPFLKEIFLAFVLFVVSRPLYDLFNRLFRGRKTISSIVTCFAIIGIVFIPFLVFAGILASSAYDFYHYINEEIQSGNIQKYLDIRGSPVYIFAEQYVPALRDYEFNAGEIAGKYLGTLSEFVYSNATSVVKGFSSVLVGFILVIFIAFYMFIDGDAFLEELKKLSPLEDRYDQEIIDELTKTIRATFKGSFIIALVQGALGSIGFLICGIDSWAMWGVVMIVASFIPVVGAALIWVPAAIFLAVTKHYIAAGVLVAWGVVFIGLADNLLRPYLLKGETNIHPLLIFFSVMGGIASFGFLGLIIGPLILALLIYVLNLYKKFINPSNPSEA